MRHKTQINSQIFNIFLACKNPNPNKRHPPNYMTILDAFSWEMVINSRVFSIRHQYLIQKIKKEKKIIPLAFEPERNIKNKQSAPKFTYKKTLKMSIKKEKHKKKVTAATSVGKAALSFSLYVSLSLSTSPIYSIALSVLLFSYLSIAWQLERRWEDK